MALVRQQADVGDDKRRQVIQADFSGEDPAEIAANQFVAVIEGGQPGPDDQCHQQRAAQVHRLQYDRDDIARASPDPRVIAWR